MLRLPEIPFSGSGLTADDRAERKRFSKRPLLITAVVLTVLTGVLLPVGTHQLPSTISFMPAMIGIVACFDVMSVYLLLGDYRDRGDLRMLVMALAYLFSLVVMGGYALAFPGAISVDPPLALTPSMAPYYYVLWHTGFPLLLGAAWAPWPARWTARTPKPQRSLIATAAVMLSVGAGVIVVAAFAATAQRLPVLIVGLDFTRMTTLTAPIALPLVALALAASIRGTSRRTGPERWTTIAILVCLCDLILTYGAGTRFSLGWYVGRSMTLVAAAVVLVAMLAAFQQVKAQAEYDASTDQLTGLQNRRSAYEALEQLVARSHRSGAPLGVLNLDLDLFKQVNDRFGHETGDEVLAEVGRLFTKACRRGDVVARVGGEEFLILLPDTDEPGTMIVADKIRLLVSSEPISTKEIAMSVSVGATMLRGDDADSPTLLRRSDIALYQAKAGGRNRVVMAPNPVRSPASLAAS
jgi:diguanylate cyclase (GGDEF)-like protein